MEKFVQSLRILPRWIIMLLDMIVMLMSVFIGYALRYNFKLEEIIGVQFKASLVLFGGMGFISIMLLRSYAGIIRYTSIQDGMRVFFTSALTAVLTFSIAIWLELPSGRQIIPFSIIIISFAVATLLLVSYRILVKYIFAYYNDATQKKHNVLIFGAGKSGLITKQMIQDDTTSNLKVVGFLEDNHYKVGKVINGTRIYKASSLSRLVQTAGIHEVIIAVQALTLERQNELVDDCLRNGVKVRRVPPSSKWIKGEFSLNQIKEIKIEDLLGREAIRLNSDNVKGQLKGKTVLISGAAGSIGSEIVRQVLSYVPERVLVVDQAETGLYNLEMEIRPYKGRVPVEVFVGDITNERRMEGIFQQYKPDVVYHAAAYKHVPLMEQNPSEAIICNVFGSKTLADLSVKYKVERFVMISTDKAVNPTNVMGASKRIAEIYVQSLNEFLERNQLNDTHFIITRFGNVLGSNGSVIPLFKRQIAKGGPVTVTHPDITRYFMTIPEACQLVMEAGAMGKGGEIFIFDMGQSVKIVNLAKKMIQLSGLQLGRDIDIVYTGLRDGEKLYEELLNNKENTLPTHHQKIMRAKVYGENYERVSDEVEQLVTLGFQKDEMALVGKMKSIVPEFVSNASRFEVLDKKPEDMVENEG